MVCSALVTYTKRQNTKPGSLILSSTNVTVDTYHGFFTSLSRRSDAFIAGSPTACSGTSVITVRIGLRRTILKSRARNTRLREDSAFNALASEKMVTAAGGTSARTKSFPNLSNFFDQYE